MLTGLERFTLACNTLTGLLFLVVDYCAKLCPLHRPLLQAFTPALTLLLCVLAGLERFTWPLLLSVLMIAGGTAGAVLLESGTPAFSLIGFGAFMASSLTEAARVVGAELLQVGGGIESASCVLWTHRQVNGMC